jgi:hypothetical protein
MWARILLGSKLYASWFFIYYFETKSEGFYSAYCIVAPSILAETKPKCAQRDNHSQNRVHWNQIDSSGLILCCVVGQRSCQ